MEKIYISGTGRCGTTFLMKLLSFLDFNTGFNRNNYMTGITPDCNAGLEKNYKDNFFILKNPTFIHDIKKIIDDKDVIIKHFIIPIRNYETSAKSRIKYEFENGGLWNATDEESQIAFFHSIMSNYLYYMVKHNIPTIFLDFDKMISNKKYLYEKLKIILDRRKVPFKKFCQVYDEVSLTSKPLA